MKLPICYAFICFQVFIISKAYAQRVVFDRRHFEIVNENGAVRLTSELNHINQLEHIKGQIENLNVNLSSLVGIQQIIYGSLAQVDHALKDGLAIRQLLSIMDDIFAQSTEVINMARSEPLLLLFAEEVASQVRNRSVALAGEVSGFIVKEGADVLMDFEKRDFLLRKITLELKVIRAQVFTILRSMYWAKNYGILKSANPFKDFVNRDLFLVDEIIREYYVIKE